MPVDMFDRAIATAREKLATKFTEKDDGEVSVHLTIKGGKVIYFFVTAITKQSSLQEEGERIEESE